MKLDLVAPAEFYKDDGTFSPAVLFYTLPETETEVTECGILFENRNDIPDFYNNKQVRLQVRVIGGAPWLDVWIPRMRAEDRSPDESVRGVAELLFTGDLRSFQSVDSIHHCTIYVQDNALFGSFDVKKPIMWSTPFGQAQFLKIQSSIPGESICAIGIDLNFRKYDSWQKLLIDLGDYLDELMGLISFLCKKHIHWYKLRVYFYRYWSGSDKPSPTEVVGYREPVMVGFNPKAQKFGDYGVHPLDLLVRLDILQSNPNITQNMFTQYVNKDWEDSRAVQRIISVLMVTHTNAILEQQLGIVYTTLEMLVSRFAKSKDELLKRKKFSKLKDEIRTKVLTSPQIAQTLNLTSEEWDNILPHIEGKLPELNRLPYRAKLLHLFAKFEDLLPARMGKTGIAPQVLISELLDDERMVSRRNNFIHKGEIESDNEGWLDVSLIRFFVSAWILDILGYPLKAISQHDTDLWQIQDRLSKRGPAGPK